MLSTELDLSSMHSSEPVIFTLPVLPRVKKYLAVHLAGQPMLASPDTAGAGLFLWALAQSEKVLMWTSYKEDKRRRQFPLELTAEIGVGICDFDNSRKFALLNHAEVLLFNRFIDSIIMNEFITLADASGLPTMQAVKRFAEQYDFSDEDLSEGALRQRLLRHRKGQDGRAYSLDWTKEIKFVPVFPLDSAA